MKPRLLLSWSSGKDSAWTLHQLRQTNDYHIVGLVTTINESFQRVAMHAVRDTLLEAQAQAAGLPLWRVPIPYPCSNADYEQRMRQLLEQARAAQVTHMAFGDLYLEDVRAYREGNLNNTGISPVFPLWKQNTTTLAHDMLKAGIKARLTCIDPRKLPTHFAGQRYDEALLAALPAEVDACGENGEFHTFCYAGPMFEKPIAIQAGEVVERDGFVFADLLPA